MKPNAIIVVLSKYPDIFYSFRDNVDDLEPKTFKILIRDGKEIKTPDVFWWTVFNGEQPFNFSRNMNKAWKAAYPDDVIVCGDDVRFTTPFVDTLRDVAYSDPKIGVAVPELGGQSVFVCGYFKRKMLQEVGEMDERFDGYGAQDNDYYRRYEELGYRTQPTKDVHAVHVGGTSFYRTEREGGENVAASSKRMWDLYNEKWKTHKAGK